MNSPKEFFKIVDNPETFEFKGFNLFNLFYNEFLSETNIVKEEVELEEQTNRALDFNALEVVKINAKKVFKIIKRQYLELPALLNFILKILYWGFLNRIKPRFLFYGAQGRYSEIEGIRYDLYNARVIEEEGRERFIVIEDSDREVEKEYQADIYLGSLKPLIKLIKRIIIRYFWEKEIQNYARKIVSAYPKLELKESRIIKMVVKVYAQYIAYWITLKILAPKRAFMICYYGREQFVMACRENGVSIIELQHGSIGRNHNQYNFPKEYRAVFHKALFPDKIAVYGQHWKRILTKNNIFHEREVLVIGYYLKVPQKNHRILSNEKQVILISSQSPVQEQIIDYVEFLKGKLDENKWQIIIKPHPKEEHEPYQKLLCQDFVALTDFSIYKLLTQADIHISVYSAVLYEAVRYEVCNYTLFTEEKLQFSREIVDNGIARLLMPDEIPALYDRGEVVVENYFEEYKSEVLFAG